MKVRLDLGVVLAAIYQIFLGSVEAYGNQQHYASPRQTQLQDLVPPGAWPTVILGAGGALFGALYISAISQSRGGISSELRTLQTTKTAVQRRQEQIEKNLDAICLITYTMFENGLTTYSTADSDLAWHALNEIRLKLGAIQSSFQVAQSYSCL